MGLTQEHTRCFPCNEEPQLATEMVQHFWTNIKFNKGKWQVLQLGRSDPVQQDTLGARQQESSSEEAALEGPLYTKLTMSQKCALTAKINNALV